MREADAPAPPQVLSVDFVARSHGLFIFGIRRDYVGTEKPEFAAFAGKIASSYYGGGGYVLNIAFSDGAAVRRNLLAHDGMVLRQAIAREDTKEPGFAAHVFQCVLSDSNQNGMLDHEDRSTLILVRPDLSGDDLRIEDAESFSALSRDQLLVETGRGSETRFWVIDAETFGKQEIAWGGTRE